MKTEKWQTGQINSRKVSRIIDLYFIANDDLRRVNEASENTIETLKMREGTLTSKISTDYVDKGEYAGR